jgi:MSHA biogenesis protein MshL
MKNKVAIAVAAALSVALTGCSIYQHHQEVSGTVDNDNARIADLKSEDQLMRYTTFHNDIYVGQLTKQEADKPAWWFAKVDYQFRDLPFDVLLQQVFHNTPVSFKYLDGLNRNRSVTVGIKGRLGDALNAIANSAGYSYLVQGDTVEWSKFETKVFDIATYPGEESFGIGKTGESQTAGNSNSSADTATTASVVSSPDEFSHAMGNLDPFGELEKSVALMLSPEGKVSINQSSTSIVVRDYPSNISKVGEYIDNINEISNRQVSLKMEIIDVQYSDDSQFALDWNAVNKDIGKFGASIVSDTATGLAGTTFNPGIITISATDGKWSGSEALIQALSHQGKVTNKSVPQIIARNNRAAKLRNLNQKFYISERTATTSINVGTEAGIKQGLVETGLSLYAVPKIMNNEVILRLTTNLSQLLSLDRKSQKVQGTDGTQETYVESPNIANKDFDNSVTIQNGRTLILAGLSRENGNTDEAYGLGVATGATSARGETLIAITPIIQNQ